MGTLCYSHDKVGRNRNNIIIQNMTNNINEMNIYNNLNYKNGSNSNLTSGACCPSCNEPSGNNFRGSGDQTEFFDCLKCGEHQSGKSYYKCKNCNGIFCTQCPFNNHRILKNKYNNNYSNNLASCPACGEPSGTNFRGSGDKTEFFDCLKCGEHRSGESYYHCKICKGIFCAQCPFNNNINKNNMNKSLYSCPACGEPSGSRFCGSGDQTEFFDCLKCGEHQSGKSYYKCKICNGIFCSNCPQNYDAISASCPSCGEPAGKGFKGSGDQTEFFDCLKCGEHQSGKSYYKCKKCKGLFCYNCPFGNR